MRTLYRLVYKNGDHGAWDDDIDRIRKYAKFFHADIESREFKMWDEKQAESEDKNESNKMSRRGARNLQKMF